MSSETDSPPNLSWFRSPLQEWNWLQNPYLWLLAVAAMVGDAATTWYGIQQGLQEANPLARAVLHTGGLPAMWAVKTLALLFAVVAQGMLPGRYSAVAPALPAVLWGFATVSNSALIVLT